MFPMLVLMIVWANFIFAQAPVIIGIAGGTGSGKTTIANQLLSALGPHAVMIEQDCYYKDLSHLSMEDRAENNFDHPQSIDFERLSSDIMSLKAGKSIEKPKYSFKTHSRELESTRVEPSDIIIVEGILLLCDEKMRDLIDIKIYVETDADVRVLRRIERDIEERGRDFISVKKQYLSTVKPMHEEFVESSRQHADIILPGNSDTSAALRLIVAGLQSVQN